MKHIDELNKAEDEEYGGIRSARDGREGTH
jgi:hypothetical protein